MYIWLLAKDNYLFVRSIIVRKVSNINLMKEADSIRNIWKPLLRVSPYTHSINSVDEGRHIEIVLAIEFRIPWSKMFRLYWDSISFQINAVAKWISLHPHFYWNSLPKICCLGGWIGRTLASSAGGRGIATRSYRNSTSCFLGCIVNPFDDRTRHLCNKTLHRERHSTRWFYRKRLV